MKLPGNGINVVSFAHSNLSTAQAKLICKNMHFRFNGDGWIQLITKNWFLLTVKSQMLTQCSRLVVPPNEDFHTYRHIYIFPLFPNVVTED